MKHLLSLSCLLLVLGLTLVPVAGSAAEQVNPETSGINATPTGSGGHATVVTITPAPVSPHQSGEVEMPISHPVQPIRRETTVQPTVSRTIRTPETTKPSPTPTIARTTPPPTRTPNPTTIPGTQTIPPTTVTVTATVPPTTITVTPTTTIPVVTVTVLVFPSGPVFLPAYYYPPGYNYPINSYYPLGSITVTSSPSEALVILDGINTGTTPYIFTGLAPGYHTIEVDYSGYEAYITNVYLDNGASTEVDANLVPLVNYGSMVVDSTPRGADVYVDGNYEGSSPVTVSSLTEGAHQVELHLAGYEVMTTTENVAGGQGTVINLVMVPYTSSSGLGSVDITSNLPGALVYLDGIYKGSTISGTTFNLISVSPGSHTVLLHIPGYTDFTQSVVVYVGQVSYVNAVFTQQSVVTQSTAVASGGAGSIVVTSTPAGGQVFLDDQFRGVAPVTIYNVVPGTHIINMKLPGYNDWSTSVTVPGGQVTQVPAVFVAGGSATPVSTTRAALSPVIVIGALAVCAGAAVSRVRK